MDAPTDLVRINPELAKSAETRRLLRQAGVKPQLRPYSLRERWNRFIDTLSVLFKPGSTDLGAPKPS